MESEVFLELPDMTALTVPRENGVILVRKESVFGARLVKKVTRQSSNLQLDPVKQLSAHLAWAETKEKRVTRVTLEKTEDLVKQVHSSSILVKIDF